MENKNTVQKNVYKRNILKKNRMQGNNFRFLHLHKMGNSCLGSRYALLCLGGPQLEASVLFWV